MSNLEQSPELRCLCLVEREMSPLVRLLSGKAEVVCCGFVFFFYILHGCSSDFGCQWTPRKWKNRGHGPEQQIVAERPVWQLWCNAWCCI